MGDEVAGGSNRWVNSPREGQIEPHYGIQDKSKAAGELLSRGQLQLV